MFVAPPPLLNHIVARTDKELVHSSSHDMILALPEASSALSELRLWHPSGAPFAADQSELGP